MGAKKHMPLSFRYQSYVRRVQHVSSFAYSVGLYFIRKNPFCQFRNLHAGDSPGIAAGASWLPIPTDGGRKFARRRAAQSVPSSIMMWMISLLVSRMPS